MEKFYIANIARARETCRTDILADALKIAAGLGYQDVGIKQIQNWHQTAAIELEKKGKTAVIAMLNDYTFSFREGVRKKHSRRGDFFDFYFNLENVYASELKDLPVTARGSLMELIRTANPMAVTGIVQVCNAGDKGCIRYDNGFLHKEGAEYMLQRKPLTR